MLAFIETKKENIKQNGYGFLVGKSVPEMGKCGLELGEISSPNLQAKEVSCSSLKAQQNPKSLDPK